MQLADLNRLELWLGPTDAGYLEASGTLRDLPPGSHLDPATGHFTWAPAPGYFGTYRLAFVQGGAQTLVDVTLRFVTSDPGQSDVRLFVDTPTDQAVVSGPVTIAGWALAPQASIGSGIDAVHMWATRTDVPGAPAQFVGAAALDGQRPDVAAVFGAQFDRAGFGFTTSVLGPGDYDIVVYAWCHRTGRWEDARMVRVTLGGSRLQNAAASRHPGPA